MKIDIEIPDNLAEFLRSIGLFRKEDPDVFLKDYVQMFALDSVVGSLDTLGDNSLFMIEDLERIYGLEIRMKSKLSESDVKRLKKDFVKRRSL